MHARCKSRQCGCMQADRAAWTQEGSHLRGTIQALEAQIESARTSSESADTARRRAPLCFPLPSFQVSPWLELPLQGNSLHVILAGSLSWLSRAVHGNT